MKRINPRVLGMLVVLGGVCAALPYHKRGNVGVQARKSPNAESIEWRSNDFSLEIITHDQPLKGTSDPDDHPKSPAFGGVGGASVKTPASLDHVTQPPALAGAYEPAGSDAAFSSQGANGLGHRGGQSQTTLASEADKSGTAARPLPSVAITHEITDGDTLEALAEKHLGSRLRWTEIYNANPEILDDPEVLPLGVTIVILPGIPPPSATGTNDSDSLVPVSSSDLLKFRDASE